MPLECIIIILGCDDCHFFLSIWPLYCSVLKVDTAVRCIIRCCVSIVALYVDTGPCKRTRAHHSVMLSDNWDHHVCNIHIYALYIQRMGGSNCSMSCAAFQRWFNGGPPRVAVARHWTSADQQEMIRYRSQESRAQRRDTTRLVYYVHVRDIFGFRWPAVTISRDLMARLLTCPRWCGRGWRRRATLWWVSATLAQAKPTPRSRVLYKRLPTIGTNPILYFAQISFVGFKYDTFNYIFIIHVHYFMFIKKLT